MKKTTSSHIVIKWLKTCEKQTKKLKSSQRKNDTLCKRNKDKDYIKFVTRNNAREKIVEQYLYYTERKNLEHIFQEQRQIKDFQIYRG